MIDPGPDDIGRIVIYRDRGGHTPPQRGAITSFNPWYVFVRYDVGATAQATSREDLEWEWPASAEASKEMSSDDFEAMVAAQKTLIHEIAERFRSLLYEMAQTEGVHQLNGVQALRLAADGIGAAWKKLSPQFDMVFCELWSAKLKAERKDPT